MMLKKINNHDRIDSYKLITRVFMWVGIAMILLGVGIGIFQVLFYLMKGEWIELPLILVFSSLSNSPTSWLNNPQSWVGLNKIIVYLLKLIPLSFFLFAVGCILAAKMSYDLESS